MLDAEVRAPEKSTGGREPEEEVLGCAYPAVLARRQGEVRHSRLVPLPLTLCGAGLASQFPPSLTLPSSHSSQALLALESGQVCPKKVCGTLEVSPGVRRNGRPQWWERWSAQSRIIQREKQEESVK